MKQVKVTKGEKGYRWSYSVNAPKGTRFVRLTHDTGAVISSASFTPAEARLLGEAFLRGADEAAASEAAYEAMQAEVA